MIVRAFMVLSVLAGGHDRTCERRCPCVVSVDPSRRVPEVVVPESRAGARAVFLGRVVAIETVASDTFWFPDDTVTRRRQVVRPHIVRYTFASDVIWKGSRDGNPVVMDYSADSDCRSGYTLGQAYLVFADRDRSDRTGRRLITDACSRVLRKEQAALDLALLGRGRGPHDKPPQRLTRLPGSRHRPVPD
jgi:hypothetical protein